MPGQILFVHLVGFCRFDAQMMTSMLHEQQGTAAIARWHGFRLTNRWSQPLAAVKSTFDFMEQFFMFATLAPTSGGSAPSR